MTVRAVRESDAFALGLLVTEALQQAPSAELDAAEVAATPHDLGRELVTAAVAAGAWLLAGELQYERVGAARLTPREFMRSHHVADLLLLVHPRARRLGCASTLLDEITTLAREQEGLTKLSARVSGHDVALRSLLMNRGWERERLERGALWSDRGLTDVEVMALYLDED